MNTQSYFENKKCIYFPCHKIEDNYFNCLFCYCPLYMLGDKCGGSYKITDKGIKDCSECILPHSRCGYDYVNSKFDEICNAICNKMKNNDL